MKFSTAFIASLAAGLVAASPAAQPEPVLEARAEPLVDFWTNKNFLGVKKTGSSTVGTCVNFPPGFVNKATSAKSRSGFRCTVWGQNNCVGAGFSFNESPGSRNFPGWIDNKANSWKCVDA